MFTEHQLIIGEQHSDVVLPEYLQLWKHLYQNLYMHSDLVREHELHGQELQKLEKG